MAAGIYAAGEGSAMNKNLIARMLLLVLLILGSVVSLPAIAADPPAAAPTATASVEPALPPACRGYVGLTHHIVGCIRETVNAATENYFDPEKGFYSFVRGSVTAVMTLAVTIYGIMIGFGLVEKVGRDTFVLLLKIAAVAGFVTSGPFMLATITKAMDATALTVISYTPGSGAADANGSDYSQSVCMQNMIKAQAAADKTKPVTSPWLGIDCLLDTVIGIKLAPKPDDPPNSDSNKYFNDALGSLSSATSAPPADGEDTGMSRGLLNFFFSTMQTSILGAILALVGFFYIFGLLMLIIRALFAYIAGYMGIALLVILAPLFIPLVLFQITKPYFDKWSKLLISLALQPIISLVFIIFSLTAVDLATFSGDYSLMYRIAGDASRERPFSLNTYFEAKEIITDKQKTLLEIKASTGEERVPIEQRTLGGIIPVDNSSCTEANANDPRLALICSKKYDIQATLKYVDWDKLAAARTPTMPETVDGITRGQKVREEVLASLFFCCVVVFMLNGLLAVIPMITADLLGDLGQSPNITGLFSGGSADGLSGTITKPFKSLFNQ